MPVTDRLFLYPLVHAVIRCARRVFVTLEADRNDSEVPADAMPASVTAVVHPLPLSKLPTRFHFIRDFFLSFSFSVHVQVWCC